MSATEKACPTEGWQLLGPIVDGGTVFSVGILSGGDVSGYWAATGSGVYASRDGGNTWEQQLNGLTTPLISGLAVAPTGALFAGSLDAGLFVSLDYGKSWEKGRPSWDVEGTVTGMAVSPTFLTDGTAFAAMDGGGLMVTRNNGRTWEDASFGLNSMLVFAVAVSPDWSRYETMWASTEEGVYISRNGGRAWRATELVSGEDLIDALAVSPAFMEDQTVYAGTELGVLHVSTDGGRRWTQLQQQVGEGPVYCLWLASDFAESRRMMAGVGNSIYRSTDAGNTWTKVIDLPGSVLSLAGADNVMLAGVHDSGVWKSEDGGQTWEATAGIAARGFASLQSVDGTLYVMGPQEGVLTSKDDGASWTPLPALDDYLPITSLYVGPEGNIFVSSHEHGILQQASSGRSWRVRNDTSGVSAVTIIPSEGLGWAGTAEGKYLMSKDGGTTWVPENDGPSKSQAVLTIVASPGFEEDHTIYVGTAVAATRRTKGRVVLWRSRNKGRTWHQVTTQETESRWMDITMPLDATDNPADQAVVATGPFCLRPLRKAKDVWISTAVDPAGANVLSILATGEVDNGGVLYAATGNGVYRSNDGGRTWHSFSEGAEGKSFVSLALGRVGDEPAIYALSLGGLLYRRTL
ncbi:MAG: WD40/YVTN/BNR-like repeat-containing protein [Anaerolineae bacterium]|jgi:photosystem II stability/assembly factor-like uncharacterized protein